MRVTEAAQERGDALEAEDVGAGRQRGEAVELRLHCGGRGRRVVGHSSRLPLPSGGRGLG
ncbi:hypothetical protein NHF48_018705 [Sphingomonas sp. H160509]|uniref:hypothetical protein n=1 Tax=Sphingomonas sp. H160509 TaxID=2955313 RepID=UPI002097F854|nr:hypothetical protein [Sphingomonas sp. H160509]